jgi:hypothetical protein
VDRGKPRGLTRWRFELVCGAGRPTANRSSGGPATSSGGRATTADSLASRPQIEQRGKGAQSKLSLFYSLSQSITIDKIMNERAFRRLTPYEMDLMNILLGNSFPGRDELVAQLATSTARAFDDNGSFEFHVASPEHAAQVKHAVPSEGECEDDDGVIIHFLLHVRDSFLKELEIFKEDNSKVKRLPHPCLVRSFSPQ